MTRQRIAVALLVVAAGVQSWLVLRDHAIQWTKAAWRTRAMPAEQRGALFLLGTGGMEYMWFLKSTVPAEGAVVVPYRAQQFSEQNTLQFFLLPRGIPACLCEGTKVGEMSRECTECLLKPSHYVPAIGEFPPNDLMSPTKELISFPDEQGWFRGVYVPASSFRENTNRVVPEPSSSLPAAGVDALIYLAIFILGSSMVGLCIRAPGWAELLVLSTPLGLGGLTLTVFVAGWFGIPVTAATFAVVAALLLALFAAIRRLVWGTLLPFPPLLLPRGTSRIQRKHPVAVLALAGLVLIGALAVLISLTRGYSTYDGIANWALKGYAIAYENSIFAGRDWGGHGLAYPQNIHLSIALFRLFDHDALPGSKLLFPLLTWSMVYGCIYIWRRTGVDQTAASLAGLVIVTMPLIFDHATLDFANLPFTSYIVLGVLWLFKGLMGERSADLLLGSALLGMASWTRPEGSGFALLMLLSLAASAWLLHRKILIRASTVVPYLVPTSIWLAFGIRYMAGDEIGGVIQRFGSQLAVGNLRLSPLLEILSYASERMLSAGDWRLVTVLIVSLLALGLARRGRPASRSVIVAGSAALVAALIPIMMFFVALPRGIGSGTVFLDVSFDRALFPGVVLLFWTAVAGLADTRGEANLAG